MSVSDMVSLLEEVLRDWPGQSRGSPEDHESAHALIWRLCQLLKDQSQCDGQQAYKQFQTLAHEMDPPYYPQPRARHVVEEVLEHAAVYFDTLRRMAEPERGEH